MSKNIQELYRYFFCGWLLKNKNTKNCIIRVEIANGCCLPLWPQMKIDINSGETEIFIFNRCYPADYSRWSWLKRWERDNDIFMGKFLDTGLVLFVESKQH
jgi:hypothetical protein